MKISSKKEFIDNKLVSQIRDRFADMIIGKCEIFHSYPIDHKAWKKQHGRNWECSSLADAFSKYWWHGSFGENSKKLTALSNELKSVIDEKEGSEHGVFRACVKILDWGQVYRGSIGYLVERYESGELSTSIRHACCILDGEKLRTGPFEDGTLRLDSGMTKIYSLYCTTSIIYDDRVASAIALIVVQLFGISTSEEISRELRLLKIFGHGDKKKQRVIGDNFSYGISRSNHARFNLLANWLIDGAISKAIVDDKSSIERIWEVKLSGKDEGLDGRNTLRRKIESALFMIGSDVNTRNPR